MKVPLPLHSYQHSSRPVGCERLVNCFIEAAPPQGKSPTTLMRAPGIASAVSLATSPGRGIYTWQDRLYAVSGTTLYLIDSAHVASALGTIGGTPNVSFAQNTTQLVVCSPPNAFVWNGGTLTQITDVNFTSRGAAQAASLDSYILFREPNSGRFFSSLLNDALTYNGLYFATAEGFPDNLAGLIVDHRQILLAGTQTFEIWYDTGGSGFPFARDSNGFLELGCASGATLAKADNSIYWLASDLTVRRLEGLTPVRVSHHGVEQAIRTYTVSDAYGFGYTQDGHIFYVLTFPTSGHSWVYDATTQEWHERASYTLTRWRPCSTAFCYGRNYVQDFETGKIGYMSPDVYDEWGQIWRSEWTYSSSAYANGNRTFHSELECLIETGVGLSSGQGSDPVIMLDISDDGGRTWRASTTQKIGKIGTYRTTVYWNALGSSRDRVYRMAVSDPVKVTVYDTQLEVN